MAGLSPTGFTIKRLDEIKQDVEAGLRSEFGDIDVAPQSMFGQLIGPFAQGLADVWELALEVWLSQDPNVAEGVSLENAAALVGVTKLGSARSSLTVSATGAEGTIVPANSLFSGSDSDFTSQADAEISQDNLDRMRVRITASSIGELFTVTIDGVPVSIVASTTTPSTTAAQLRDAINAEPVAASAVAVDDYVDVLAKGVAFVGTATSAGLNTVIAEIASPIPTVSLTNGAYDVSVGVITDMVTPVAGVDAVTNRKVGVQGRVIESDADLRRRRSSGVRGAGAASIAAMAARLREDVPNVLSVNVFENEADTPDIYGRPPHSFEVVVEGAEDRDIANNIWRLKPGGIPSFGNTEYEITDIAGNPQTVKFSRPAPLYIWARVTIESYNLEEAFPATGTQQITDFLVTAGNRLAAGVDVVRQRLFTPIYQVPGLEDVKVELFASTSLGATPVYAEQNIVVAPSQRARFDGSRVVVVP